MDPPDYATQVVTWGLGSSTAFTNLPDVELISLAGGVDASPTEGNVESAYDLFNNKETVDVSLLLSGGHGANVQNYIITSIAAARADCVAFVSPPSSAVVNNAGNETTSITTWLTDLGTTSTYAVADSGYKYQYDKYNNVYRWIPLNGDIAGLCVYTDTVRDPWFSPAGLSRGQIKNAIKLAWNPNKTQRDTLYAAGVNPVVSFPGQGIVLFGDKTLTNKPSAFDRINVRRLFLVLEKAIATSAKYSLFEQNDEFTRAQFVSTVTPFLRDVQGRRGITDFKVVCDTTNNTTQVIDSNQFVGDIYIKPSRSVNFIQLNFVAVGTGVDFNTIVGVA
jgi:phage tail sheath protein FI